MSLEPSVMRTLEDKIADFEQFVAERNYEQAKAVLDSFVDWFPAAVDMLEAELERAKLAE